MKKFKSAIVLGFLLGIKASSAFAMGAGDQGWGVMAGNPSGLSGKMWFSDRVAMDGAFGIDQGELDAHLSLLLHDFDLLQRLTLRKASSQIDVPFYMGVGPRILFDDDAEFGIRTPVGLSFLPHQTDWEIFTELAPVLRLSPSTGLDFDYAIGARYYFRAIRPKS